MLSLLQLGHGISADHPFVLLSVASNRSYMARKRSAIPRPGAAPAVAF